MKEILFVGAGSVGGYFGAHLSRHNPNVSFLLRPRSREAVAKNGLTIRSAIGESFTVHPKVASDPKELPQPDLIVLGIKAYDLDEVMDQIEPVLKPDTTILTLQNGVTIEDTLMARFGRERIVGGVAFIYSRIAEPGVIDHYKKGMLAIGEPLGMETSRLQVILELFKGGGLPCFINPDIRRAKWEKMCWNCVFNPLTVLLNDRVAKALDHPEFQPVIATIVREVSAVAMAAHRVPLDEDMPQKVVKWAQELRDIHTSMYDDWLAGRPTEIDELNGFISGQGKAFAVPTPMNDMLTAFIKAMTISKPSVEATIQVGGAIMQSLQLTRTTLAKLPAAHQISELPALMPGMNIRGVKLQAILDVVTLDVGADHVTFESQDGKFSACLTIKQAVEFGILLYEMDGAPFPTERGGPFRLVTPGLGDLCANVKQIGSMIVSKGLVSDSRPPQVCPEKE
ncbi:2-dehydropantoate 2-reductase [Nitrospira sp. MA-1]|nr:2-dehydropantoate 2-reductase [Nitrospira sp. MA-1]